MDAINATNFIDKNTSEELIEKVRGHIGVSYRDRLDRPVKSVLLSKKENANITTVITTAP